MIPTFTLKNGVSIPSVGYGTWAVTEEQCVQAVLEAVEAGYRHIDTASYYGTEEPIGRALKRCPVKREELFLTTKAWKSELGYDNILRAFDASLKRLGVDYVDLYLLHWPRPEGECPDWEALDRESWRALERLYREGRTRAIGVSNFLPHHLENLLREAQVAPMADQIEFHPGYPQWETVEYCRAHGIQVEAWSPMGRGRLREEPLLLELAEKYGVSLGQICLRFALECGVIPLPKSVNRGRMAENLSLDFTLSPEDVERIRTMPQTGWSGLHPDR